MREHVIEKKSKQWCWAQEDNWSDLLSMEGLLLFTWHYVGLIIILEPCAKNKYI